MKKLALWHKLKNKLICQTNPIRAKEKEIWYASLGYNIGYEENGKGENFQRPVIILKRRGNMLLIIPMSSQGKNSQFYYQISQRYFGKSSYLLLSQLRVIDKKRLINKIQHLNHNDFVEIQKKIKDLIL